MCYKSIVNELDKFFIKKCDNNLGCKGCPIECLKLADLSFTGKLLVEFSIESGCIVKFFYSIKEILPEDKINFLLEKLKENEIQFIDCGHKRRPTRFIKILKSVISDELEIE